MGTRSTVYILIKKADFENLKSNDTEKFNFLFGKSFEAGWGSVKDFTGLIRGESEEKLSLITLDDVKWWTAYPDVEGIYEFLNELDYWELTEIQENGAIYNERDKETENSCDFLLDSDCGINLSNLEPLTEVLNENDMPELVGQLIDQCEDYLEDNKIKFTENPERDEAIAQGEDEESVAQIYGSNYGLLADAIKPTLSKFIACPTTMSSEEAEKLADNIITALWGIMVANKAELTDKREACSDNTDFKELKEKLIDTMYQWNLVSKPNGKFLLIHVCDRDISTHAFTTFKQARQMMELEYNELVKNEDLSADYECSIEENTAWVNAHNYDHDWKIVEVA